MLDKYRLTVWLMAGAGLRVSEALAVTEDCVRGDVLRVRQQAYECRFVPLKHRAVGDYRDIPLPKFLREEISQHTEAFGSSTVDDQPGVLFRTSRVRVVGDNTYRAAWRRAVRRADVPDCNPHDLRHFFASTALAGGVSLLEVSRWLGHASISITADTYGRLTEDASERARRVMQEAFRPPLRVVQAV
jgi:integrase